MPPNCSLPKEETGGNEEVKMPDQPGPGPILEEHKTI